MKIKLRLWDGENKRMLYAYEPNEDDQPKREYVPFEFGIGFSDYDKTTYTIMLSTGLLDKDMKLVYDCDIIEDDGGDKYLVAWDNAAAGFLKRPLDDTSGNYKTGLNNLRFWRVIGNLFEQETA